MGGRRGGDWNLDTSEVALFSGFRWAGLQILSPPSATCHASAGTHTVRDFFVTGGWVGLACREPCTRPDLLVPTHDLVEMEFLRASEWPSVKVARRPPHFPVERPMGPKQEPPDWAPLLEECVQALAVADRPSPIAARQAAVDALHDRWLEVLKLDFGGLVDASAGDLVYWGGPIVFRDMPLDQALETKGNQRARASSGLRWLAGMLAKLEGLQRRCAVRGDASARRQLRGHLSKLRAGLAAGGKFAYHYQAQADWTDWEKVLLELCEQLHHVDWDAPPSTSPGGGGATDDA